MQMLYLFCFESECKTAKIIAANVIKSSKIRRQSKKNGDTWELLVSIHDNNRNDNNIKESMRNMNFNISSSNISVNKSRQCG